MHKSVTAVTHNHPEGIKGALATTSAIWWAKSGLDPIQVRKQVSQSYCYDLTRSVDDIRDHNPHSEACQKTVPEAITCALESESFEDAIRNAISIGGDSDTIAAIAGSIAEAMYGGVTAEIKDQVMGLLDNRISSVVTEFYAVTGTADEYQ